MHLLSGLSCDVTAVWLPGHKIMRDVESELGDTGMLRHCHSSAGFALVVQAVAERAENAEDLHSRSQRIYIHLPSLMRPRTTFHARLNDSVSTTHGC